MVAHARAEEGLCSRYLICVSIVVHCIYFFCHSPYFGGMPCNGLSFSTLTAEEGRLARNMFI